ncbi:MAG TPA: sugar transferase [bacterium]|nr:sugar transferase [bacterium]
MRILYLDQYFSDRDGISGTRGYEFARRWTAQGHRVTVLALASRYSSLSRPPQRHLIRRMQIEGIDVVSVRVSYAQHMGFFGRVKAFLAYMVWATLLGVFLPRHDVVFATSTPLTVGVPGLMIRLLRGTPFVFEVRDLWPRAPIELGALNNPWLQRIARYAERLFYRRAARLVALSPGMVEGVRSIAPVDKPVALVPNACDFDLFDQADPAGWRERLGLPADAFVVVHAGNLGPSNDGDWLVDLAAQFRRLDRDDLWLLLLGEGNDRARLELRAATQRMPNIVFAGPVTRRETAAILCACDLGLVSFADLPVLRTNSPNKFFDCLAAGMPVAVNTDGWTAELLREADAGLVLPRHTRQAATQIAALADDPPRRAQCGRNARELATRFERGKLATQVLAELQAASEEKACGCEQRLKRAFDLLLTVPVLLIGAPFLLAIALAIRLDSPGPIFFRQERLGRDGRAFRLWKFRTMVEGAATMGDGLNVGDRDWRITRVGHFLRTWSLDELPQLFNVLAGEMSLVGPRPALPEHAAQYDATQRRRLRLAPGLTGLAQVSGRNALSWDEKLAKDVEYVQKWSFWRDLKIMVKTFPVVLGREGLYEPDAGKSDRFNVFDDEQNNRPDA